MKTISLKIDETVFGETEKILSEVKSSRNRYINEALDFYNKYHKRRLLQNKLKNESLLVREESILILKEFENLQDETV